MNRPALLRLPPLKLLDRFGLAATLLCPIFLVHGRAIGEAMIDATAIAFLLHSGLTRDWMWARQGWVRVALLWWMWLVLCSVPVDALGQGGGRSLLQALLTVRFLMFAAALQSWSLREARRQRLMGWLLAASLLYISAQLLLQAAVGVNLFGDPRFHDGTLTGPYDEPRAAAPLSRLLFPTLLPAAAWLMRRAAGRRSWVGVAGAVAMLLAGLAVMVLAGQRMPLLLTGLGFVVAGLMLRWLRGPLLACLAAVPALVAASAVATPRSFAHLVLLFERQMRHFGASPYGLILARALVIARDNPWTGRGFDGFRTGCRNPLYFHGLPPLSRAASDGGGAGFCVQHPHNHYLQALTDSGVPGLVLFCLMVLSWLSLLARGRGGPLVQAPLVQAPMVQAPMVQAWGVGLFVSVLIQEWPIASSSAFTNMPLGGWFFLLLGLGLAVRAPTIEPAPAIKPATGGTSDV